AVAKTAAAIRAQMTVGRPQRNFRDRAFEAFLGLVRESQRQFALGQTLHQPLKILVQPVVGRVRDDLVQVIGNRADILGDAPLVVIQDADEFFRRVRDVVERLEGNAVGQRRIAEDANHVLVAAPLVPRRAHAQRGGQGRARMSRPITIVLALGAEGKAIQTVRGADGIEPVFASGEQFVDVALVAHVPDKFILRCGKDAVQGNGELHHAQVRSQMTAVPGQDRDQFVADFLRQLLQLVQLEFLDVLRTVHHVEISVHSEKRQGLCDEMMRRWMTKEINNPKFQYSDVPGLCGFAFKDAGNYSAAESSASETGLSVSSPPALFSSCRILSSASESLDWQILARRVPSSKRASSVSSGSSSDSMASTMPSSFFSASSKGRSLAVEDWAAAALVVFDTRRKLE